MLDHFQRFTENIAAQLLVICFTVFAPLDFSGFQAAFTQAAQAVPRQGIPTGWESHLDRPEILKLQAKPQDLGKGWGSLKAAHFSFVAELLALYPPDTHLYFLARDSEYLYDVARLVTEGTPEAMRMHLLNVSRANMWDQNLKEYLRENGISEETIKAGRKVLFIDSGFEGTIPRVIGKGFSAEAREKLKTHLVVSSNPQHPSSRAFLIHLNPSVNEQAPSGMRDSIINLEHMAKYTNRSSQYVFSEGRYHPISYIGGNSDGPVSKEQSHRFMQDLKAEWQKPETKALFQAERAQFEEVKRLLSASTEGAKVELNAELEKRKNTPEGRLLESQIRDILESQTNAGLKVSVTHEELGLKINNNQILSVQSLRKNELIAKHSEWASVLEKPADKIPELFKEKNWQMIGDLIDANLDAEINQLLAKSLYNEPATGIKKKLQVHMIEIGDSIILTILAITTFSQPYTKDMIDLIKLLIEKGDSKTLLHLAKYTFSEPHTYEPEYQVLRESLSIADPVERKTWIEAELVKRKPPAIKLLKCADVFGRVG